MNAIVRRSVRRDRFTLAEQCTSCPNESAWSVARTEVDVTTGTLHYVCRQCANVFYPALFDAEGDRKDNTVWSAVTWVLDGKTGCHASVEPFATSERSVRAVIADITKENGVKPYTPRPVLLANGDTAYRWVWEYVRHGIRYTDVIRVTRHA